MCSDTDVFTYPRELPDERDRVLMRQPDQTWFLSVETLTYGLWGGLIGVPQGVSGGSFEPCGELRTLHPLFTM